ncbi:hypothetical protein SYNPS1DRAFT_26298 [Syncephalis pseudoplumigaleata]|uniref:histidine kinase n=1 Tax=Syncephalis pseudoplumigaleata TaxID=1712513 RepID=A0A4V1J2C8_9FUNG|nr:hypothetical protein SYNPS1DRAFT_26298 [Syncephalis pseudoplumigaleata]|eukprot:RKP28109.1 hypothetical protein SYNPS1DRAFT_26298 [Syncephalis pseudoplumigaleata]
MAAAPSLPREAASGAALLDAMDTLHLQLDELVHSPPLYFRHLCDAVRVLLDAPLVAFLYPVAIDPVMGHHMYRIYGFPRVDPDAAVTPADRTPSDGAIFTYEPYATRFHRAQFVNGYGRLHVDENDDGSAETPDWWPRTFVAPSETEMDGDDTAAVEPLPAGTLDLRGDQPAGGFTKMFGQFAKSGTAFIAHYISPNFVEIPLEHLEDCAKGDTVDLPPRLGLLFCIFLPASSLRKFPVEARESRMLEVDWLLRVVASWLRAVFANEFAHLGTEDDYPLDLLDGEPTPDAQAPSRNLKRPASDALENQDDCDNGDDNGGDAMIIRTSGIPPSNVQTTLDRRADGRMVPSTGKQPGSKRARTYASSRAGHGMQAQHDHARDTERYFSYMNRDNVFARFSHELRTPLQTIASVAQLMQSVLEVRPPESGQASIAELARTSNIIEARAQLRVILAASEKITRMIDDLIDLIFWSTTGVPTMSIVEMRTISVREMVEMAFSRVKESLNLGGFLNQEDAIKAEYTHSTATTHPSAGAASPPALEGGQHPAMRLEIADGFPEWIQVDRNKIMRVLKHLIRNACQAVGPQGEVVVRVSMEDGEDMPPSEDAASAQNDPSASMVPKRLVVFSVSDNGSGIRNDIRNQLFILHPDDGDPSHEGAGMGLVVCKGLVQSMSGELWLERTSAGEGSEFRVRIPLHPASSSSNAAPSHAVIAKRAPSVDASSGAHATATSTGMACTQPTAIPASSQVATHDSMCMTASPPAATLQSTIADLRVLVVEDNFVVRKLMVRILGRLGLVNNVVECENGLEAVQQCQKQYYDLVLMDCGMPVMDGFTASRQIRAMYGTPLPDTPNDEEAAAAADGAVGDSSDAACHTCQESQSRRKPESVILSPVRMLHGALPRTRIVAVTANASYAHRQRVLQSGIDYCILKPVRFDDLHEVVRQLAVERNVTLNAAIKQHQ